MAGGNEAQRSNRFDLPKNMAFTESFGNSMRSLRFASFPPAIATE
jgi:hypothetical protein